MKFRKKEIIITLIIVAACLIWWGVMYYNRNQKDYGSITISVSGKEYGTYSLGKDQVIEIGETNTCTIKDGQATMTSASCPDHLCMYMSPIDAKGGVIICLPNEVVIEGTPAKDTGSSGSAQSSVSTGTTGNSGNRSGSSVTPEASPTDTAADSASEQSAQQSTESSTEGSSCAQSTSTHSDASGDGYWTTDLDSSDLDAISGFTVGSKE